MVMTNWAFGWDKVKCSLPEGRGLCLDLGCANGRHQGLVQEAGWTWVGLDVDATRSSRATIRGDALSLPLADEKFDLVLLWQVLEHLPQPWTALSEVSRILKVGGRVVGSVSCLEPIHDVCSYFGFTHRGLAQVLGDCGFVELNVRPGLNAFSLITRSWFRHLFGVRWGERMAFPLVRISFTASLWAYLFLRGGVNLLRRGKLGTDYAHTLQWLAADAPLEFAGHLAFRARKSRGEV